jgi:acetyl-CoA carboxylase biotin carboxylase subunit
MMFSKVLIANRGEIALRIIRACKALNIETVAIYSTADRGADYLTLADQAVCIGPGPSGKSYMNPSAIILAALHTGAEAIHPGYGFLSENAAFAEQVEAAGLVFIGPTAKSIRQMGDKIAAREAMQASGVPCVPGSDGEIDLIHDDVMTIANTIGFPVMIKASAGGGGRGMRIVRHESDLISAIKSTQEEAQKTFQNGAVYLEKFLEHPRHIEIQVLSDTHGHCVWLGSRDCSLQRRHQKVLEEAPAPNVDPVLLSKIGALCSEACKAIGYRGAGTFEFLYEAGEFFFIEMNTRVQVEHPITEIVTGVDIVQWQIEIAQGKPLTLCQEAITSSGFAIECRINAEDPSTFMPTPGTVQHWQAPGGNGVRVDSHLHDGAKVPSFYDSLVAKIITYGATREEAFKKMRVALAETQLTGITSNIALHQSLVEDPVILSESVDIHYLENRLAQEEGRA